MNSSLQFDFIVDRKTNTITIKREFAANRQLVWDCHTKSEFLNQWFAPKPLTTKTKSMDFSEGGHWHFSMVDPDGNEYWSYVNYLSISPIEHYTTSDSFSDESGKVNAELPSQTGKVTFVDTSSHTLVTTTICYQSLEDLEQVMQMGMEAGFTSTLERLDELLLTLVK